MVGGLLYTDLNRRSILGQLICTTIRPELVEATALEIMRGRREGRVQAAPMARQQIKKLAAGTTGLARASGLPCAMVLRLIRDLPGARALLPPSRASLVSSHT